MAVDRGGMRYEIEAENNSAAAIAQFRTDVKGARDDFRAFKKELATRQGANLSGSVRDLGRLTDATRRASAAAADHTRVIGARAREIDREARAIADANRESQKKQRAEASAAVSAERNFEAQKRLASATLQRARAEQALTNIIDKRNQLDARKEALQARGVELSQEDQKALGVLSSAELTLLNAKQRLATAQQGFHDKSLLQIRAETDALARLTKVEQERLTRQILSAQGKTPQGTSQAVADRLASQAAALTAADEDKATASLNRRGTAIKQVNRAFDAKIQSEERAAESARRNFALETRQLTQDELRSKALASITRAKDRLALAQERLAAAEAAGLTITNKERLAAGQLSQEEFRLATAKEKLATQAALADPELQRINAETEALRRQNKVRTEQLTKEALAARGLGPDGSQLARAEETTLQGKIRAFLGLGKSITDAEGRANRAAFTFRRLFGILAAFTAVRLAGGFFKEAIKDAVQFTARLEQAQLGIAGIIAATADVRTSTGEAADASTKFAVAQQVAGEQVRALRKDALLLTASVDDLIEAFQVGLATGIKEGLNVDQVRLFTRQIQIAAQAIGLSSNQLSEEIRSILSGTINPRNTRIAQALGITNEDIRRAKEQGKLFEFLQGKFEAFNTVGQKAAGTLTGLFTRLKNVLQATLGEGALPLVNELKIQLGAILQDLVQVDASTGAISLNPELVKFVGILASGLQTVVKEAVDLKNALSAQQFHTLATAVAGAIGFIARFISDVVQGSLVGINTIINAIAGLRAFIQSLTGIDIFNNTLLRAAVKSFSAIAAAVLTISLLVAGLGAGWKIVTIAFGGVIGSFNIGLKILRLMKFEALSMNAATQAMNVSAFTLVGRWLAVLAAIVAVAFALDQMRSNPLLNLKETKEASNFAIGLRTLSEAQKQVMLRVTGNQNAADESMKQWVKDTGDLVKEQENLKHVTESFADAGEKIRKKFKDTFEGVSTDAQKAFDEASKEENFKAFLLTSSQALEDLRQKLNELNDEAKSARDTAFAEIQQIGLGGAVASQSRALSQGEQRVRRESLNLDRDRQAVLLRIAAIQKSISSGEITDAKELERLAGMKNALEGQSTAILTAQKELREAVLRVVSAELLALSAQNEFEVRRANATAAVEAANARLLRIFDEQNNVRALERLQSQQDLALAKLKDRQEADTAVREIQHIQDLIDLEKKRRDVLREALTGRVLSREEQEALDVAEALVPTLERQRDVLQEQAILLGKIKDEEIKRLERNAKLAQEAESNPIGAGIGSALRDIQRESGDTFKQTVEITKGAINGLSELGAQMVGSWFDPNSNFNLRQALGNLLLQTGEAIIAQLLNAIIANILIGVFGLSAATDTAATVIAAAGIAAGDSIAAGGVAASAALSAGGGSAAAGIATGGSVAAGELAGASVAIGTAAAGLGTSAIVWEPVTLQLQAAADTLLAAAIILSAAGAGVGLAGGGSAKDAFRHRRRIRGYAEGGSPSARSLPTPPRPAGLSPKDKLFAWLDPTEWVIRGLSVAKAGGWNVMDRINRGLFDPYALQAAVGLRSFRQSPMPRRRAAGLAGGGAASSAVAQGIAATAGQQAGPQAQHQILVAVVPPSEENMERQLRGGQTGVIRLMEEWGFQRR
jgi:hypothetical protein